MKLLRVLILVLFVGYLNVGCASTESPEQLIEKPVYDQEKQDIYDNIKRVVDKNATIILPKNSSEVSSINSIDLDNDGVEELVVFEKEEDVNNNTSEVGLIILNEGNGKNYSVKAEYKVEGNSIEYANFYDLDNNGKKEIVLSTKTDFNTELEILKFEDNKIVSVSNYNPTWISNKSGYTETKVKIGDLDNDDTKDIIVVSYNPDTHNMAISLAYFDKYIKLVDFKMFNDVKSMENVYIEIHKVYNDKNGIVVDTRSFKEKDSYVTQILYLDDDKELKKAFSDDNEKLKKPYYVPVEDINEDGIVEIPILNNNAKGYRTKNSANVSWYKWNGDSDEFINLVFVSQVYYNYKNNFKLWIPNILANKVSVEEDYKDNKLSFDFYYYDNLKQNQELEKLFTITKTSKNKIDEGKGTNTNSGGFILFENETDTFILTINSPKTLKDLNISKEAIQEYFSMIYEG